MLPINVTPRENQPPVFGGGVIDFEPGETKVLDLVKLTNYPYPKDLDELAYSVVGHAARRVQLHPQRPEAHAARQR